MVPRKPGQLTLDVLHIRPGQGNRASAADMDLLLAQTDRVVESCENVFTGLARLCRSDRPTPGVLFVCLDGLTLADMEFFSIASQWRGAPDIYVYGDAHKASMLDEAVRLGATGPVTDAVINALGEAPIDKEDESGDTLPFVDPTAPEPVVAQFAPQVDDDLTPTNVEPLPTPTAEVETSDDTDTPAGSARVPWQRYQEGPSRTRPQIRQAPVVNDPPTGGNDTAPDPHEPLLSAAELEALLGDDISAIVPDRPPSDGAAPDEGASL